MSVPHSSTLRSSVPGMSRGGLLVVALAALCGCRTLAVADTQPQSHATYACASGERAMQRDTLYFGRNRPGGGTVGDAEWRAFIDDVVVPLFPDGFTVLNAEGHWRGGDGAIEREASQLMILLHAGDAASNAAVAAIAAEYKRRFAQEAVLRERSPSCAMF